MKTQHGKRGLFTPKWWLGAFVPQQRVHPVRKFRGPWWALACSECPCVGKLLRGPGDARDLLRLSMFGFGNRSTAIAPPITAAVNANILAAGGGISPLMATSIVSGMFAGAMPPPLGSRDDHRVRQRGPARGGATSQWPLRERPALTHDKTIGIVETCEGGTTDLEAHTPASKGCCYSTPRQVWREARGVFRPTSSFGHVKYTFNLPMFLNVAPELPEQAHKRRCGGGALV